MGQRKLIEDTSVDGLFEWQYSPDVYCNDSLEAIKSIPNESIDLVITSPPYNLGKEYEKKSDLTEYLSWYQTFISKLFDLTKETGSVCWQTGNYVVDGEVYPLDIYFYPMFKSAGFHLRNRIIWHFGHGLHCSKRLSGRYETILWFTKTDQYKFNLDDIRIPAKYPGKRHFRGTKKGELSGNPKGKNPSDFWQVLENDFRQELFEIPNVKANHPEKTDHPCQFPVELVERCVLALTDEGDTILDPFAGVGTTGIAALKRSRHSILIENNKRYFEEVQKRIGDMKKGLLKTREIGTKIHSPSPRDKIAQIPEEWQV